MNEVPFQSPQQKIQQHGNDAEDQNGEDHPVQFEHLTTINYHVAETLFGTDKFSDDDTNQTQSDIDLHDGEQIRNVGGQNDLEQDMRGISVKCP